MRKSVSLGLLALILSICSTQVLASNAEVCDGLKKAQKGLHGLCVAWHNADEKNKGKIEDKFLIRAGYPLSDIVDPVTGLACPCWTDVSIEDDILALCEPLISRFTVENDLTTDGLVIWFQPYNYFAASATETGCAFDDGLSDPVAFDNLELYEVADCIAEIEVISNAYLSNPECDG